MGKLEGRSAIVTGGGDGLGAEDLKGFRVRLRGKVLCDENL
jgi:NAD(P)-dependent dehydrogenase (short-subunit alcohol dehydrogenase family)